MPLPRLQGPAAAALPAALPRLPPLPPVAVPTTAASPAEAGAGAEQPLNWLLFAARHCTPAGPCQSSPSSLALEGQLLQRLLPAAAKALQELERYVIAPLERPPLGERCQSGQYRVVCVRVSFGMRASNMRQAALPQLL